MSRLNEKDLELLQTGQTINLSTVENAYYGGEFTTNPNDCVEVFIYDTNKKQELQIRQIIHMIMKLE